MERNSYPEVRSYLSVHLFLQDIYHYRKANELLFSYENWAQEMGISSKSYLRFACLGKRNISEDLTEKFCRTLKFSEPQKEYFILLVLYTQTAQSDQKRTYGKRLTQIIRESLPMTEIEPAESLMAQPLYLMIRNVLSFQDVPKTSDFLAKVFCLEKLEIEKALEKMQQAGFIKHVGDQWHAIHRDVKFTNKPNDEILQKYHTNSLLKAIEAHSKPVNERNFRSLGLALTTEEYQSYLLDLDSFAKQTYAKYSQDEMIDRRIYQLNFNLFPWTETAPKNQDAPTLDQ